MEELLQAPTDGVGDAIVVPPILANQFELKIGLLNLVTAIAFHVLNPTSFPPFKTTNLRNEITRFQQRFGETLSEAWDRFKDLLNKCPHHGFSPLHQIDTFYNSLNQSEQDSLNSAAGGNFLTKNTQEALTIIENKSKNLKRDQEAINQLVQTQIGQLTKALQERPQGVLPGNTIPNPREDLKVITTRSGVTLAGPSVPPPPLSSFKEVERDPESTTDQVLTESTTRVPPLAV
ncbi:reverse transcriptase domain-containing protein [Tanacetum coccineum]